MSEKKTYSIRELENLSGIPAHTIRTWERRYGLLSPVRDKGNSRCYARDVVGYLRQVALLLKHGHRISALACKSHDEIHSMVRDLEPPLPDDLTAALCSALTEFQQERIENLIRFQCKAEGFEKALEEKFAPFLEQTSFLMLSGILQPMHIELFTTVLRQKIYSEIDNIRIPKNAESWLLVHASGSHNSVYKDILTYLFRRNCKIVIPLSIPSTVSVLSVLHETRAKGCCIVIDDGLTSEHLEHLLGDLVEYRGNTLAFTPGKTLNFVNNTQINHITIIKGLPEAFQFWKNAVS